MPDRIYIETTVVSYFTSRPSRDVVIAGHQQTTHEWWDSRRTSYELCISEAVLDEAASGDPEAAQERLDVLHAMTLLETSADAISLAQALVQAGALPAKAADDALHVAVAAVNRIQYFIDVELPPFGERGNAAHHRNGLCEEGLQSPDHLHARRTLGGEVMNDPIVDEIRQYREAHAARFNFDLEAIYRDIKEREKEWEKKLGRKFVSYAAPPAEPAPQSAAPAPPLPARTPLPEGSPAADH